MGPVAPSTPLGLRVIGTIRTRHHRLEDTPVQAPLAPAEEGRIELDPRYVEGLDGLDTGSPTCGC